MKVPKTLRAIKNGADTTIRGQQIGWVLSTYGVAGTLGHLGVELGRLGLKQVGVKSVNATGLDAAFGRNLANTFVHLGPTFIKLGQVLATRPDFVGDAVANELRILFDRVPPISYRQVRSILKQELGKHKFKHGFKSIDSVPLASASISQAHRAVLSNGTPVILKVQKPGVKRKVQTDLVILGQFVAALDKIYPKYQLKNIFKDFKEATLCEIDYRLEAQNIDKFQKNYRSFFSSSDIKVPSYFPHLLTERVIALEPMQGKPVSQLKKGSTVARVAATKSLASVLEQIFDHGFFHADPHAGNLFFMEEEGQLGFIDFGLVGQLEPADKQRFLKVVMAILNRDRNKLARSLYDLGEPGKNTEFDDFEAQINSLLDEAVKKGVANLRIEEMVNKLLAIARSNALHIPNRYVMMMRSCLVIEGVAKSLDPDISIFTVATPIVARSLIRSYNPIQLIRKLF